MLLTNKVHFSFFEDTTPHNKSNKYNESKVWALGRPKVLPLTSVSHGHNRTIIMALFCRSHNIVKDKGQHNKITDKVHNAARTAKIV